MQPNQITDNALTLYLKSTDDSAAPYLRISLGAPAIEPRNGDPVLTVTLSVTWGSNRPTEDNTNKMRLHGKLGQDLTQGPSPTEAQLFRFPSRFRNWYLCERDGAEWSLEVDDPTCTDACPICSGDASAIAVLRLPVGKTEEKPGEYASEFKLCRSVRLAAVSGN
jgi:hypothetical protein